MSILPSDCHKSTSKNGHRVNIKQICISLLFALSFGLFLYFTLNLHWEHHNPIFLHRFTLPIQQPTYQWEGFKGGEHCLRYATREYTARLSANVPSQEMMKTCKDTPVEIHGQVLYTDFCQDLGFGRGVWGYWIVAFDEPDCETTWGEFFDMGCVGAIDTSFRRFESHLENLQPGSSWQIMCVTTPAEIYGQHLATPEECYNSMSLGTYGVWSLSDKTCLPND